MLNQIALFGRCLWFNLLFNRLIFQQFQLQTHMANPGLDPTEKKLRRHVSVVVCESFKRNAWKADDSF